MARTASIVVETFRCNAPWVLTTILGFVVETFRCNAPSVLTTILGFVVETFHCNAPSVLTTIGILIGLGLIVGAANLQNDVQEDHSQTSF